jgi:hypothetical protein
MGEEVHMKTGAGDMMSLTGEEGTLMMKIEVVVLTATMGVILMGGLVLINMTGIFGVTVVEIMMMDRVVTESMLQSVETVLLRLAVIEKNRQLLLQHFLIALTLTRRKTVQDGE